MSALLLSWLLHDAPSDWTNCREAIMAPILMGMGSSGRLVDKSLEQERAEDFCVALIFCLHSETYPSAPQGIFVHKK